MSEIKEKFITKGEGKKEYLLLKEYDNFKKIIQEMNSKGFKYVSYVFGGYKDIHKSAIKNKIIPGFFIIYENAFHILNNILSIKLLNKNL